MRALHNRWCESLTNQSVLAGHLALVMHVLHAGQERETRLCDERAAPRFLTKALRRHGIPETMTIDGSEANAAAPGVQ